MAKVTLTDLTTLANDTSAVNSINENFQALEDYINDKVLSRDTGAEVNTLMNNIDFNGYDIVNVADINGNPIGDLISGATAASIAAAASEAAAQLAEANAATSATNAATSEANAATSATNAATSETNAATSEANAAASLATVDHIVAYVAGSGTSFTPAMADYANFHYTLTGATTINNPSDEIVGQSGMFVLIQDGTGSRLVTWGTDFEFVGGTPPTLSIAPNAVDIVPYYVYANGRILCGNVLAEFS